MIKVIGLDNKEYKLTLSNKKRIVCSEHHLRARKLLKEIFPLELIFEEVALPGSSAKKQLFADFYIHSIKLMIEVNGEQHYSKNSFFHKNHADFIKGKLRDKDKQNWCEINNISLVVLPYMENDDEWRKRIEGRE